MKSIVPLQQLTMFTMVKLVTITVVTRVFFFSQTKVLVSLCRLWSKTVVTIVYETMVKFRFTTML